MIIQKWGVYILNLDDKIDSLNECEKCRDVQIKKFTPLKDLIDFGELDGEYMRCECQKRPLDIVMSHILKIMIEEEIVPQDASLRRNSPVPLLNFYYSSSNPQFIGLNTLILLHPNFTKETALRLIEEVPEVECVLKGSPSDIIGQVIRLHNYLENNDIKKGVAIDAMCGLGALGIYLIKYGFKKVIFNDVNPEMIEALKNNLEINDISEGYEISNLAFEDLKSDKVDLCVVDAFPGSDIMDIEKKAEKIADAVFIV